MKEHLPTKKKEVMKHEDELIGTHAGLITYLNKDKEPILSYYAVCCSNVRYTTGNGDAKYIVVHIPEEVMNALGKGPYQLLSWVEYLNKIGLPCEMWSVKPDTATICTKNYKTAKDFIAAGNYSMYFVDKNTKKRRDMITRDSFYKVIIPLNEYHPKGKAYWQFVTWTLLRYFYSVGYCNLIDYTFMFKAMYPALDRVKCLMLAHAGIRKSHFQWSALNNNGETYNTYNAYHGLVSQTSNMKFMNQSTFTSRLKEQASGGGFVNSFATMTAKDGRDIYKLFDEGKFDELYKLALEDE